MFDDSRTTPEPGDAIEEFVWNLSVRKKRVKRKFSSRQLRQMVGGMLEHNAGSDRGCCLP